MNWLNRLPGTQRRAPTGVEWTLWRRLPAILLAGTALPGLAALGLWAAAGAEPAWLSERHLWMWLYGLAGVVVLHWTLVFTLAIGCVVVMIMKGPAYVADAYPPAGREPVSGADAPGA